MEKTLTAQRKQRGGQMKEKVRPGAESRRHTIINNMNFKNKRQ